MNADTNTERLVSRTCQLALVAFFYNQAYLHLHSFYIKANAVC